MLASNNVSKGRVVTKVQFDTKVQFPKVLFSPAGAVDPKDFDAVSQQGKSTAAEAAIKLSVYKKKSADDVEVEAAEPTLRESTKRSTATATDASDVIKKWSKK
jgi:hypothetical protein